MPDAWVIKEMEFADTGPVLPVGCRVSLFVPTQQRVSAEVRAVQECAARIMRDTKEEQVIIAHNGLLSAVPKKSLTMLPPAVETTAYWKPAKNSQLKREKT